MKISQKDVLLICQGGMVHEGCNKSCQVFFFTN